MKVAVITSIKAPYRTLQLDEICKKNKVDMTVYYTKLGKEDRDWETKNSYYFREVYLKNIKLFECIGSLNLGLKKIVENNELIIIGGYEKPTYIVLSILCRLYKKKYIIIYDGISCDRLNKNENVIKKNIKNLVIKHSSAIWGNGTVSRIYFNKKFNYPRERIFNQYLTIDGDAIKNIGNQKEKIRKELRKLYEIEENQIVLHYSGRLVEVKNVEIVIRTIKLIDNQKLTLLITGGGKEEENLKRVAEKLGVKVIITGFINNQNLLFKHYYMSDLFILPSIYEPWGLVVNEAMFSGLPVLVSNICGCSLDLVKDNGYKFNPLDKEDLANKIKLLLEQNLEEKGNASSRIIENWSFQNSSESFEKMIDYVLKE